MAESASNSSIQPNILAASQTEKSMNGMERHITEEAILTADWTPRAETILRRKLDFIVLPILFIGLFALQLDKGNISYIITTTFTQDIGITSDNVNYGNQLMLAAIVIFEVPFNMVLSRTGPALWLTIQIFAWGTVATAQVAVRNLAGFYASRFFLGMWEAGYLAASLSILATFYTRREMAMRVTMVYIGNYFSAGTGGLIAGAVFKIPESTGLKQWQWLFLINGLFTFLVGILFILVMPRSFNNTLPLCGLRCLDFFSAEDRRILHGRVMLDDPRKLVQLSGITPRRAVTILFSSLRVWGHFAINVVSLVPKGALSIYSPTIIKSLGFDASTASFLSSVYNFGVCLLAIAVAWVSDRTAIRGGLCLICAVYSIIFSGVQFSLIYSTDVWLKYAILTLLNSGMAVSQGINDAWLSVNTSDPQERCLGLALAVAGSNLGGVFGQNVFVAKDAPYYHDGFLKILCLYGGNIVLVICMLAYYWNENRTRARVNGEDRIVDEKGACEVAENGFLNTVKNQL